MVGHALQHFRAVDVSVVGVRITEEKPYKATLTAVFPDGTRRQRSIEGVLQSIYLDNIRPEYSRIYNIKEAKVHEEANPPPRSSTEPTTPGSDENEARKRQTKERLLSDKNGLDQQQLLMASSTSAASGSIEKLTLLLPICLAIVIAEVH